MILRRRHFLGGGGVSPIARGHLPTRGGRGFRNADSCNFFLNHCFFSFKKCSIIHNGLSTLKRYHNDSMGLHEFFHLSATISCITFHLWKSVDCYFLNKVYRDILRFLQVHTKSLKYLCTLNLKNSNLQIFKNEILCMKL